MSDTSAPAPQVQDAPVPPNADAAGKPVEDHLSDSQDDTRCYIVFVDGDGKQQRVPRDEYDAAAH